MSAWVSSQSPSRARAGRAASHARCSGVSRAWSLGQAAVERPAGGEGVLVAVGVAHDRVGEPVHAEGQHLVVAHQGADPATGPVAPAAAAA